MILILHIVTAIGSLVLATIAIALPSQTKLRLTYALAAATLASGTYMVISLHAPLVSSCETGLVYLGAVTILTVLARKRLLN